MHTCQKLKIKTSFGKMINMVSICKVNTFITAKKEKPKYIDFFDISYTLRYVTPETSSLNKF